MNILHLNYGVSKNNLSFPHYQFHKLLLTNGHNSTLMVSEGDVSEQDIKILKERKTYPYLSLNRISRKLFKIISRNKQVYYYPEWNTSLITEKQIVKRLDNPPDIIIAYWTKYAFNQKMLYKLGKRYNAPIILFQYDMAHLTGGCHYSFGCEKYKENCKKCPALNPIFGFRLSYFTWKYKKRYLDKTDAYIISMSNYLSIQTKDSSLYKNKKAYEILGTVDEEIFCPGDRALNRKYFGLEENKKVIFFGAVTLGEPRKGLKYLLDALNILKERIIGDPLNDEIHLLIAGNKLESFDLPFDHTFLGYLNTQEQLAKAYQSADVFVCPSVEDSGPMMINISIVTGTPVVSFDMGVAANLVHNSISGYRAKLCNSKDLANGIYKILTLNKNEWLDMSKNCRQLGIELCSKEKQYKRLMEIIKDIKFGI